MNDNQRGGSRGWLLASRASIPLVVLLTLALLDWDGTGTPRPFVMFFLPALVGVLGGLAGAKAGHPALAVCVGLLGIIAVPVALHVVLLVEGP